MALVKTVANSAPTVPTANATRAIATGPLSPGAAHQSAAEPATSMTEKPAIHGFRAPIMSAMAPRIGDRAAMTNPAAPVA